ncbi:hypothetical protein LTS03_002432 [Exophiala xenobiotica]|nr:hypothetical protein LTR41_010521 [Exophiala xenobiotica]KAK5285203.1 hypothetical protein LTR14_011146 [Exophiala xenobiotica]KAK5365930.1 hypothetical protein LTS13_008584 [Exophiala xenobiotica]KAK5383185.1 hypothetical protein LTR11_002194 [Exophiala xenobiotica]KAK5384468.1 hypothetical protein LTS03_002432 [Exophiala xenobiotica]
MDAPTENHQNTRLGTAQPEHEHEHAAETIVSKQPAAPMSMDPSQSSTSTKVGLRGGGEGEDVCCGM